MRFLLLSLLYLALLTRPALAQPPDAPLTLPSVTSYSLSKAKVTLPADLSGNRNLLLLFFKRDQQEDADLWITEVGKLKARDPALGIYTLPIFPRANILSRWWTNASLRSGAPPQQNPATTIPLYVDKQSFLRNLRITSEKQPVLLVTDKSGRVLGRASGRPDPAKLAATEAILQAASPAHR
ncbi:MAG: hypothetical protein ACR2JE_12890 [Acidobacteriaceae bacterium]